MSEIDVEAPRGYASVMVWVTFNPGKGLSAISDGTGLSWADVLRCLWYAEQAGDAHREDYTVMAHRQDCGHRDGQQCVTGGKWFRNTAAI